MYADVLHCSVKDRDQEERQPADMIEMTVGEKNVERLLSEMLLRSKEPASRIQRDPELREKHTCCVSPFAWVVTTGTEEDDSHGVSPSTHR